MCFLALAYRMIDGLAVVAAANRDECLDRPGLVPQRLADGVWGGKDPRAGGTWLGVNRSGALAAVTNLHTGRPPDPDARSRGVLCLDLLTAGDASAMREQLGRAVETNAYNPLNLLAADEGAAWAATFADGRLDVIDLAPGLHVIGNTRPDARDEPKVVRGRRLIGRPAGLDEAVQRMQAACRDHGELADGSGAICVHAEGRGTLSSTIVAIHDSDPRRSMMLFCDGPPCENEYRDVSELIRPGGG